jgi:hypothetical protein
MKHTFLSRSRRIFAFLTADVIGTCCLSTPGVRAATDTARVVKYAQNDIVRVNAKLRFSTLIILPKEEEILDFTTGDKEFWIINGAHNLCYIHPPQAVVQRAMRHTSPETKRRYQLGMAEQVRQAVEKVNQRLYGKHTALHFGDSQPPVSDSGF